MKINKTKLLICSLVSMGLVATLVPTLVLTSCSATANPYLTILTSTNSTLTYTTKSSPSARQTLSNCTFTQNFSNNTTFLTYTNGSTSTIDPSSVQKAWADLKSQHSDMPNTNEITDSNFQNKNFTTDATKLIEKSNYLVIFNSLVNNIRNIFDNFLNVLLVKEPNNDIIKSLQLGTNFVDFANDLLQGRNINETYARLWLSDVKFSVSLNNVENPGTRINGNENSQIKAAINSVEITFEWFQALNKGSEKITDQKKLQELGIKNKSYKFNLNSKITGFYFNQGINDFKDKGKFYNGVIPSNTLQPFEYTFTKTTNSVEKSDWINREFKRLKDMKLNNGSSDLTKFKDELDILVKKIGYLDQITTWPKADFPSDLSSYKQKGIDWLKGFFQIINPTQVR